MTHRFKVFHQPGINGSMDKISFRAGDKGFDVFTHNPTERLKQTLFAIEKFHYFCDCRYAAVTEYHDFFYLYDLSEGGRDFELLLSLKETINIFIAKLKGPDKMIISLIIALDENNVIGQDDRIPWHEPNDFLWFVAKTRHKAIVMGRKTFDGLANPLPNRLNIVLSKDGKERPGAITVKTPWDVQKTAIDNGYNELVICGGVSLYEYALNNNIVDKIYLTRILKEYEGNVKYHHPLLDALLTSDKVGGLYADKWVLGEKKQLPGLILRTLIKVRK